MANRHEMNINFTQPNLPQVVMTYHDHSHPIKTKSYKPSYLGQILMDLYEIFSIRFQWVNRHELNINFTQPHLPQVVRTNQYHSHPIKTNTYKLSYLCQILIYLHYQELPCPPNLLSGTLNVLQVTSCPTPGLSTVPDLRAIMEVKSHPSQ